MCFKMVDQMPVEFDKGTELQLHSRFGQSDFRHDPFGHIETPNGFEEFIEFILVGATDKINEKNNQDVKR